MASHAIMCNLGGPNIKGFANFAISPHFDHGKSTEENYSVRKEEIIDMKSAFVGKYAKERAKADYSYHQVYEPRRQLLHDSIIDKFLHTIVLDSDSNETCSSPLESWLVFTAGAMGVGKGHVVDWLHREGIFPLDAFVRVDPDHIRDLLPETPLYTLRNPLTAGFSTQKEVGYISEALVLHALSEGKNVLIDGSLRDVDWYRKYISNIREMFPKLKVAIIHVFAKESTVLARARHRAEISGRVVPEAVILDSLEKTPISVGQLANLTNFVVHFQNEDDWPEPRLIHRICGNLSHNEEQVCVDAMEEDMIVTNTTDWKGAFKSLWKMTCPPNFGRKISGKSIISSQQTL